MKIKTLNQQTQNGLSECDCGSRYFVEIECRQYSATATTALSNRPACTGDKFYFLKCVVCNSIYEPNTLSMNMGDLQKRYGQLMDQIEGIQPSRPLYRGPYR